MIGFGFLICQTRNIRLKNGTFKFQMAIKVAKHVENVLLQKPRREIIAGQIIIQVCFLLASETVKADTDFDEFWCVCHLLKF